MQSGAIDFFAAGGIPLSALMLASCLLAVIYLDSLVECFPSLLRAMLRWKESENINYSTKLSLCRTRCCFVLMPPFLFVCARYCLFAPAAHPSPMVQLGLTAAAWVAYLIVRRFFDIVFRSRNMKKNAWNSAVTCPESFFCILTAIMVSSVAVFHFSSCSDDIARTVLLTEIGLVYMLCIIRKTQIFHHYGGGFSGFLYLCTLEIIPSGLLIAADILL